MADDLGGITRRTFLERTARGLAAFGAGAVAGGLPMPVWGYSLQRLTTPDDLDEYVHNNNKPVVLLVTGEEAPARSRRMRKVVQRLIGAYGDEVDFYEFDSNPIGRELVGLGKTAAREYERRLGFEDTVPLAVMYARDDIVTGERYGQNTIIDTMKGGPHSDADIETVIENLGGYWIATNLLGRDSPDKDGKVYRLHSTFEDWKPHEPQQPLALK